MFGLRIASALLWLLYARTICAIQIDWDDSASVKAGAATAAYGLMSFYSGNVSGNEPGLLPQPYYWWQAGAMFGGLVDYWHYTGDVTYLNETITAMQYQVGEHQDYMPSQEAASLGNDDQAFWAMAALRAAEVNFPDPPEGGPSWLGLAQAVFNEQIGRWDTSTCNGGIRWQIYPITGYNLKNTISNGCLFNIATRLARYTGDPDGTYTAWAIKIWDWLERIGLIDSDYNVFDNSEAQILNCTQVDRHQWTYNAGTLLMGASTMYNFTNGSELWYNRTHGLLSTIALDFFPNNGAEPPDYIMKDICEQNNACNVDQHSFKAYLSRWMGASSQMAPFTYNVTAPLLLSSARAAASQCIGNSNPAGQPGPPVGQVCGLKWYDNGTWDGSNGVGQQMAAMEVILSTMINPFDERAPSPATTNSTGGTSKGNPSAGYNSSDTPPGALIVPAGSADRGGAWFLTVAICLGALFTWVFMSTSLLEGGSMVTVGGNTARKSRAWKGKERAGIERFGDGGLRDRRRLQRESRSNTLMSVGEYANGGMDTMMSAYTANMSGRTSTMMSGNGVMGNVGDRRTSTLMSREGVGNVDRNVDRQRSVTFSDSAGEHKTSLATLATSGEAPSTPAGPKSPMHPVSPASPARANFHRERS